MMKTRTTTFRESSSNFKQTGGVATTTQTRSTRKEYADSYGGDVSAYLDTLPHAPRSRAIGGARPRGYRVEGTTVDTAVLSRAVRVGSPVSVDSDPADDDRVITKRYVREVEVPYTRQVKVPVEVDKVVTTTMRTKVPTTRIVEVPGWREVDEVYTETQEVPAVREKEVWVKKIVQEPYMKKVEVKKTRKARVPATDFKEVTELVEVEVPVDRLAKTEGYRVDEVEDTKLVEVEEFETFRLQPYPTGERQVTKTREIGAVKSRGAHLTRTIGSEVYHRQDVESLSSDDDEEVRMVSSRSIGHRTRNVGYSTGRISVGGDFTKTTSRSVHSARSLTSEHQIVHQMASLIGITIKNHDRGGCRVIQVHHARPAFHAGIKVGDVIVDMDNIPTLNLNDFRRAFDKTGSLIAITVKRSGNLITMKVRRALA
jgi:hypothetical protein